MSVYVLCTMSVCVCIRIMYTKQTAATVKFYAALLLCEMVRLYFKERGSERRDFQPTGSFPKETKKKLAETF